MGQGLGWEHDARQLKMFQGSMHGAGVGAAVMGSCARLGTGPARLAGAAQPAGARLGRPGQPQP